MALVGMPDELFEEILARLPVKSLVKFRSLSKFHRDLIKKFSFITRHFQFSAENPRLLILHYPITFKPCISLFCDEYSQTASDLGLPINPMPENLQAASDLGLPSEESQSSTDFGFSVPFISQYFRDYLLGCPGISQPAVFLRQTVLESSQPPFELTIPQVSQPPVDLKLPFPDGVLYRIEPYGPCNGILCLCATYEDGCRLFVLWNPATREVKALPSFPLPRWGVKIRFHGFGFDPKTKDYKVVCILLALDRWHLSEISSQRAFVEVYSLSKDSWRRINVTLPVFDLEYSFSYSYLNGVCHWLAKSSQMIVCFDLSSELFYTMKLPLVVEDYTNGRLIDCSIAVLNDCIAYVKEYRSLLLGHRIEIWLMNEHGVEESWNKCFSIGPLLGVDKFRGFWKDREILVTGEYSDTLISYNLDTQQPVLKFPVPDGSMLFAAIEYVESIFPTSVLSDEETSTT